MEKRFKIPSKNIAVISTGNDISQVFAAVLLTYFVTGKNQPRWMSYALFGIAIYCFLCALPHFIYGAGDDALRLTKEYGEEWILNSTGLIVFKEARKELCNLNGESLSICTKAEDLQVVEMFFFFTETLAPACASEGGDFLPQFIFFTAQVLFGIGESIYYVFGLAYLDDNSKRSQTPMMISVSYFLKMTGPAVGYSLASLCLRLYIAPDLSPSITDKDPRWLGAWWLGWLLLGCFLVALGCLMRQFPRKLADGQDDEERKIVKNETTELKFLLDRSNDFVEMKLTSILHVHGSRELYRLKSLNSIKEEENETRIELDSIPRISVKRVSFSLHEDSTSNDWNNSSEKIVERRFSENETKCLDFKEARTSENEIKSITENGPEQSSEGELNLSNCEAQGETETVNLNSVKVENETTNISEENEPLTKITETETSTLTNEGTSNSIDELLDELEPLSARNLLQTLNRLVRNKVLMLNNFSTCFYLFAGTPFLMFGQKYLEIQYNVSASMANYLTGSIGFIFTSFGILLAGAVITYFKPRARYLTGYNVLISVIAVISLLINYHLGCTANDNSLTILPVPESCHCEYVKYAPICGGDNRTYVSACHAGCEEVMKKEKEKIFFNCLLIEESTARSGGCLVDCQKELWMYLVLAYLNKFLGASGITSNFLVGLR